MTRDTALQRDRAVSNRPGYPRAGRGATCWLAP